jgi:MYXO-CTERM domain-containing protein
MKHQIFRAGFLAVAISSATLGANAEVLLGNQSGATDAFYTRVHSGSWRAFSFTMPQTGLFSLDNIVLRLNYSSPALPVLELRGDNGGSPGSSVLVSFARPNAGGAAVQDFVFLPSVSFNLQEEATYWVVARCETDAEVLWYRSQPSLVPTGQATYNESFMDSSDGSSWSPRSATQVYTFAINATPVPVPEPAPLSLLALAALAGLAAHRPRK